MPSSWDVNKLGGVEKFRHAIRQALDTVSINATSGKRPPALPDAHSCHFQLACRSAYLQHRRDATIDGNAQKEKGID